MAQILSPARVSTISPWACVGLVQATAGRGLVVGAGEDEPGGLDARVVGCGFGGSAMPAAQRSGRPPRASWTPAVPLTIRPGNRPAGMNHARGSATRYSGASRQVDPDA